ncbi:hypothetical protein [Micromonospora sp. NPDC049891]|uniref:DUF7178 family protein n=1 Tax=Micromonospora sp. NPDC049891 TaxID=3155655 RepID=UPI0033E05E7F
MGRKAATDPRERLAEIGLDLDTIVDNILTVWKRATPSDIVAGERWYGNAGQLCSDLAAETPYSRETCAAAISHLSPRTSWTRNVAGAVSLLHGGDAAGCLGENVKRARRAMASTTPLDTFGETAPKTTRFARNILGDREQVTVDVWAARIAFGPDFTGDAEATLDRKNVYAAVEHAYRLAAGRAGVDPTTMQATTWVVIRGKAD